MCRSDGIGTGGIVIIVAGWCASTALSIAVALEVVLSVVPWHGMPWHCTLCQGVMFHATHCCIVVVGLFCFLQCCAKRKKKFYAWAMAHHD